MMDKNTLRKEKIKCRAGMSAETRKKYSKQIAMKLVKQPEVLEADAILCYVNYKSETETDSFMKACLSAGKRVFCPRVLGETEMEFYEIASLSDLGRNVTGARTQEPQDGLQKTEHGHHVMRYAIPEPDKNEEKIYRYREGDCIILPGTVFDKSGNRIGYGKGYYDRYLGSHPGLRTVGICFSCQMADSIPAEETDIRVNKIITENEVYTIV